VTNKVSGWRPAAARSRAAAGPGSESGCPDEPWRYEPAIVEIRAYSEDEWLAEAEGKTLTSDEFLAHLRRAPDARSADGDP
jgi:hypothetical protein